jgi:hypothetical protein
VLCRAALDGARCKLAAARWRLRVVCRMLSVACCPSHVVRRMLSVACCPSHAVCCPFHVASGLLARRRRWRFTAFSGWSDRLGFCSLHDTVARCLPRRFVATPWGRQARWHDGLRRGPVPAVARAHCMLQFAPRGLYIPVDTASGERIACLPRICLIFCRSSAMNSPCQCNHPFSSTTRCRKPTLSRPNLNRTAPVTISNGIAGQYRSAAVPS